MQPHTLTTALIARTANEIEVVSTEGFRASGEIRMIDEIVAYAALTPIRFIGCIRGVHGTVPRRHNRGCEVTAVGATGR
jgi:hypothetical protein